MKRSRSGRPEPGTVPAQPEFRAPGAGADAYQQTLGMFALAEELLQRAGMEFRDVVRTWIHMRDIDRDYGALNRARRAFFATRGIEPAPASTGIGGGPVPGAHDLCLGIYAVKAGRPLVKTVMTSPTLNEASEYGADFVRGLRVQDANKAALLVSGTASIDEHGWTVHDGNVAAQADRMLVNLAALLERQGACFADVVHAVTYVKHPADAQRIRREDSVELDTNIMDIPNREMMLRMIGEEKNITVLRGTIPLRLDGNGVAADQRGAGQRIPMDSLVFAGRLFPRNELSRAFENAPINVRRCGKIHERGES